MAQLPANPPSMPALKSISATPKIPKSLRDQLKKSNEYSEIAPIPENFLNYVRIRSASKGRAAAPIVILEDVHNNAEAQKNLSNAIKALGTLKGKSPVVVGLEGAAGPFLFDTYKKFSNHASAQMVADSFFESGDLSGPAHAGFTSYTENGSRGLQFWGVESPDLYRQNVNAYKSSKSQKESQLQYLADQKVAAQNEMAKSFSPALSALYQKLNGFWDGRLSLARHLETLQKNGADLSLNADMFLEAHRFESKINFDRANLERKKVFEKLASGLSRQDAQSILDLNIGYQQGVISFADYYTVLRNLCLKNGVQLNAYPEFSDYIRYVLMVDGVNSEDLFKEVHSLEARVIEQAAKTQKEKNLIYQSKWIHLAQKLVDFSLTPDEWTVYKSLKAPQPKNAFKASLFEPFYVSAEKRNNALIKNLLSRAAHQNQSRGASMILVAGGFHTAGLSEILKEKNIPYIIATPKITHVETNAGTHYLSMFDREKSTLEKIFTGTKLFVAAPVPGAVTPLLNNTPDATREMAHAVISLGLTNGTNSPSNEQVARDLGVTTSIQDVQTEGSETQWTGEAPSGLIQTVIDNGLGQTSKWRILSWRKVSDRTLLDGTRIQVFQNRHIYKPVLLGLIGAATFGLSMAPNFGFILAAAVTFSVSAPILAMSYFGPTQDKFQFEVGSDYIQNPSLIFSLIRSELKRTQLQTGHPTIQNFSIRTGGLNYSLNWSQVKFQLKIHLIDQKIHVFISSDNAGNVYNAWNKVRKLLKTLPEGMLTLVVDKNGRPLRSILLPILLSLALFSGVANAFDGVLTTIQSSPESKQLLNALLVSLFTGMAGWAMVNMRGLDEFGEPEFDINDSDFPLNFETEILLSRHRLGDLYYFYLDKTVKTIADSIAQDLNLEGYISYLSQPGLFIIELNQRSEIDTGSRSSRLAFSLNPNGLAIQVMATDNATSRLLTNLANAILRDTWIPILDFSYPDDEGNKPFKIAHYDNLIARALKDPNLLESFRKKDPTIKEDSPRIEIHTDLVYESMDPKATFDLLFPYADIVPRIVRTKGFKISSNKTDQINITFNIGESEREESRITLTFFPNRIGLQIASPNEDSFNYAIFLINSIFKVSKFAPPFPKGVDLDELAAAASEDDSKEPPTKVFVTVQLPERVKPSSALAKIAEYSSAAANALNLEGLNVSARSNIVLVKPNENGVPGEGIFYGAQPNVISIGILARSPELAQQLTSLAAKTMELANLPLRFSGDTHDAEFFRQASANPSSTGSNALSNWALWILPAIVTLGSGIGIFGVLFSTLDIRNPLILSTVGTGLIGMAASWNKFKKPVDSVKFGPSNDSNKEISEVVNQIRTTMVPIIQTLKTLEVDAQPQPQTSHSLEYVLDGKVRGLLTIDVNDKWINVEAQATDAQSLNRIQGIGALVLSNADLGSPFSKSLTHYVNRESTQKAMSDFVDYQTSSLIRLAFGDPVISFRRLGKILFLPILATLGSIAGMGSILFNVSGFNLGWLAAAFGSASGILFGISLSHENPEPVEYPFSKPTGSSDAAIIEALSVFWEVLQSESKFRVMGESLHGDEFYELEVQSNGQSGKISYQILEDKIMTRFEGTHTLIMTKLKEAALSSIISINIYPPLPIEGREYFKGTFNYPKNKRPVFAYESIFYAILLGSGVPMWDYDPPKIETNNIDFIHVILADQGHMLIYVNENELTVEIDTINAPEVHQDLIGYVNEIFYQSNLTLFPEDQNLEDTLSTAHQALYKKYEQSDDRFPPINSFLLPFLITLGSAIGILNIVFSISGVHFGWLAALIGVGGVGMTVLYNSQVPAIDQTSLNPRDFPTSLQSAIKFDNSLTRDIIISRLTNAYSLFHKPGHIISGDSTAIIIRNPNTFFDNTYSNEDKFKITLGFDSESNQMSIRLNASNPANAREGANFLTALLENAQLPLNFVEETDTNNYLVFAHHDNQISNRSRQYVWETPYIKSWYTGNSVDQQIKLLLNLLQHPETEDVLETINIKERNLVLNYGLRGNTAAIIFTFLENTIQAVLYAHSFEVLEILIDRLDNLREEIIEVSDAELISDEENTSATTPESTPNKIPEAEEKPVAYSAHDKIVIPSFEVINAEPIYTVILMNLEKFLSRLGRPVKTSEPKGKTGEPKIILSDSVSGSMAINLSGGKMTVNFAATDQESLADLKGFFGFALLGPTSRSALLQPERISMLHGDMIFVKKKYEFKSAREDNPKESTDFLVYKHQFNPEKDFVLTDSNENEVESPGPSPELAIRLAILDEWDRETDANKNESDVAEESDEPTQEQPIPLNMIFELLIPKNQSPVDAEETLINTIQENHSNLGIDGIQHEKDMNRIVIQTYPSKGNSGAAYFDIGQEQVLIRVNATTQESIDHLLKVVATILAFSKIPLQFGGRGNQTDWFLVEAHTKIDIKKSDDDILSNKSRGDAWHQSIFLWAVLLSITISGPLIPSIPPLVNSFIFAMPFFYFVMVFTQLTLISYAQDRRESKPEYLKDLGVVYSGWSQSLDPIILVSPTGRLFITRSFHNLPQWTQRWFVWTKFVHTKIPRFPSLLLFLIEPLTLVPALFGQIPHSFVLPSKVFSDPAVLFQIIKTVLEESENQNKLRTFISEIEMGSKDENPANPNPQEDRTGQVGPEYIVVGSLVSLFIASFLFPPTWTLSVLGILSTVLAWTVFNWSFKEKAISNNDLLNSVAGTILPTASFVFAIAQMVQSFSGIPDGFLVSHTTPALISGLASFFVPILYLFAMTEITKITFVRMPFSKKRIFLTSVLSGAALLLITFGLKAYLSSFDFATVSPAVGSVFLASTFLAAPKPGEPMGFFINLPSKNEGLRGIKDQVFTSLQNENAGVLQFEDSDVSKSFFIQTDSKTGNQGIIFFDLELDGSNPRIQVVVHGSSRDMQAWLTAFAASFWDSHEINLIFGVSQEELRLETQKIVLGRIKSDLKLKSHFELFKKDKPYLFSSLGLSALILGIGALQNGSPTTSLAWMAVAVMGLGAVFIKQYTPKYKRKNPYGFRIVSDKAFDLYSIDRFISTKISKFYDLQLAAVQNGDSHRKYFIRHKSDNQKSGFLVFNNDEWNGKHTLNILARSEESPEFELWLLGLAAWQFPTERILGDIGTDRSIVLGAKQKLVLRDIESQYQIAFPSLESKQKSKTFFVSLAFPAVLLGIAALQQGSTATSLAWMGLATLGFGGLLANLYGFNYGRPEDISPNDLTPAEPKNKQDQLLWNLISQLNHKHIKTEMEQQVQFDWQDGNSLKPIEVILRPNPKQKIIDVIFSGSAESYAPLTLKKLLLEEFQSKNIVLTSGSEKSLNGTFEFNDWAQQNSASGNLDDLSKGSNYFYELGSFAVLGAALMAWSSNFPFLLGIGVSAIFLAAAIVGGYIAFNIQKHTNGKALGRLASFGERKPAKEMAPEMKPLLYSVNNQSVESILETRLNQLETNIEMPTSYGKNYSAAILEMLWIVFSHKQILRSLDETLFHATEGADVQIYSVHIGEDIDPSTATDDLTIVKAAISQAKEKKSKFPDADITLIIVDHGVDGNPTTLINKSQINRDGIRVIHTSANIARNQYGLLDYTELLSNALGEKEAHDFILGTFGSTELITISQHPEDLTADDPNLIEKWKIIVGVGSQWAVLGGRVLENMLKMSQAALKSA